MPVNERRNQLIIKGSKVLAILIVVGSIISMKISGYGFFYDAKIYTVKIQGLEKNTLKIDRGNFGYECLALTITYKDTLAIEIIVKSDRDVILFQDNFKPLQEPQWERWVYLSEEVKEVEVTCLSKDKNSNATINFHRVNYCDN